MFDTNKFTFGPVNSRRLGMSLGINLLGEKKKCTFNCVYCEIGKSKSDEIVGIDYNYEPEVDMETFIEEVSLPLKNLPEITSATFGYMGETTLANHLEKYLGAARKLEAELGREGPMISIFTNSTTLGDEWIRSILAKFDFIMAKLDCAIQSCFQKINRPHSSVPPVNEIIENMRLLREELNKHPKHKLAIQTLLFNSLNPNIPSNIKNANLNALAKAYEKIKPHVVQIYTVAREPAEKGIYALSQKEKNNVRHFLDKNVKDKNIEINIY